MLDGGRGDGAYAHERSWRNDFGRITIALECFPYPSTGPTDVTMPRAISIDAFVWTGVTVTARRRS